MYVHVRTCNKFINNGPCPGSLHPGFIMGLRFTLGPRPLELTSCRRRGRGACASLASRCGFPCAPTFAPPVKDGGVLFCLLTLLRAGAEARALFSLPCQRLGRGVCCRRGGGRGGASALAALRESCQHESACAVRKRRAGAFNLIWACRTYGYDPGRPGPCWVIAPGGSIVGRLKDNGRTRALGPFPATPAEQARSGETCIRWTVPRQYWEL